LGTLSLAGFLYEERIIQLGKMIFTRLAAYTPFLGKGIDDTDTMVSRRETSLSGSKFFDKRSRWREYISIQVQFPYLI
jgi:hypothetical protein